MKIRLLTLCSLLWIPLVNVCAQMTFTLNGIDYATVAERDAKGFTTVTVPAGTDPSGLITAVAVVVLTYKPTVMLANAADNTATLTANNGKLSHVRLADRTFFKDDSWNTLCLPFSMTAEQVAAQLAPAALMELDVEGSYNGHKTGLDGDKLYLYFKDATAITAGTPYLVKWNANSGDDIVSPVFRSVTLSAGEASSTTTIMMTTLSRQKLSLIQPFQLSIQL